MYPENDSDYEDLTVAEVDSQGGNGWSIKRNDGWSFYVPPRSPIEPKVGMSARFYGKGIGARVRGLFLDGQEVFYRTEAEDREQAEIEMYGANAAEWLKRWDEGKSVWSISMGGIGPGYEQAIQLTTAEILRIMLDKKYDFNKWDNGNGDWKDDRDEIEKLSFENQTIKKLGLSGAQYGAAMNLAAHLYRKGPRAVMNEPEVKDRHIQVSRTFPWKVSGGCCTRTRQFPACYFEVR